MKNIGFLIFWIALSATYSNIAKADDPMFVTVRPGENNQVLVRKLVENSAGQLEAGKEISLTLMNGPFQPDSQHLRLSSNQLAQEDLSSLNPPQILIPIQVKKSRLHSAIEEYDLDLRKVDICELALHQSGCPVSQSVYQFSAKYKYGF